MKYITKYSLSIKDIIILVALHENFYEPKEVKKELQLRYMSHSIAKIMSILPDNFFESRKDLQYSGRPRQITNTTTQKNAIIEKAAEVKQKYVELCELIKNEHQLNEGLK